jgi:hypothetical protein
MFRRGLAEYLHGTVVRLQMAETRAPKAMEGAAMISG